MSYTRHPSDFFLPLRLASGYLSGLLQITRLAKYEKRRKKRSPARRKDKP